MLFALAGLFLISLSTPSKSLAQESIYIDVGSAKLKKSLLALPPFSHLGSPSPTHNSTAQALFDVINNDLAATGLFTFIKPEAFLEDSQKVGLKPAPGYAGGFDFKNWQTIGTEFLLRIGYRVSGGTVSLESYLYFVPQAKTLLSKSYSGPTGKLRTLSHTVADDIVRTLTGKPTFFKTKLVVSSNREAINNGKEIWTMDWDGAEPKRISDHNSIAFSPTWSPDGKKITYSAFMYHKNTRARNADLLTHDISAKKTTLISFRKGINSGATYSPDGKYIYLTFSNQGNPDIYRMNNDGSNATPILKGPTGVLNLEPSIGPDGFKMAFSSTRSGPPMIFTMNVDGSNIARRTFAGKYNSSPVWSPDGKKIVFAGMDKGKFDIFIMNSDGSQMERLTSARKPNGGIATNEDPSFSPDGRYIMFRSDRTGKNQIYITNLDGSEERRITFDSHDYYQPDWSPFLE